MAWLITIQIGYGYARSQKYPYPFVNGSLVCVCDALPQALFWGKNDVPGIFVPCLCVMHCRKRFLAEKNTFL
jgi:hypothetical protein